LVLSSDSNGFGTAQLVDALRIAMVEHNIFRPADRRESMSISGDRQTKYPNSTD